MQTQTHQQFFATGTDLTLKKINSYYAAYWNRVIVLAIAALFALLCFVSAAEPSEAVPMLQVSAIVGVWGTCIGLVFLTISYVYYVLLLYNFWKIIPPDIARTTPCKAAWLFFIPVFNYYWRFVALWGLGRDMNRAFIRRNMPFRAAVSSGLLCSIAMPLAFVSAFVCGEFVGYLIQAVAEISAMVYLVALKNGAIELLKGE
ncbi:MAG: hypothetical protein LBT46_00880 [Planctomycetaceae bacterium]|jgi:hypothetical protein|nr:hypothetical protein [Planctomycetaceae bacterium]